MLEKLSLHFVIAIMLYAFVLVLGLAFFIVPAAANGLASDPIFGFTLVIFLLPLIFLLFYFYYSQHHEVESHLGLFTALFAMLTLVDIVYFVVLIFPWAI